MWKYLSVSSNSILRMLTNIWIDFTYLRALLKALVRLTSLVSMSRWWGSMETRKFSFKEKKKNTLSQDGHWLVAIILVLYGNKTLNLFLKEIYIFKQWLHAIWKPEFLKLIFRVWYRPFIVSCSKVSVFYW